MSPTFSASRIAPREGADQVTEICGQLRLRQGVDAVVEILAQAPDVPRTGVVGLRLQALELKVLEVRFVRPGKGRLEIVRHAGLLSRNTAQSLSYLRRNEHAG